MRPSQRPGQRLYRCAALFCCAHLFFWAALIRALAAALSVRLSPRWLAPLTPLRVSIPASKLLTCFNRTISLSIAAINSDVFIGSQSMVSSTRSSKQLIGRSKRIPTCGAGKDTVNSDYHAIMLCRDHPAVPGGLYIVTGLPSQFPSGIHPLRVLPIISQIGCCAGEHPKLDPPGIDLSKIGNAMN